MDKSLLQKIRENVDAQPFGKLLGMKLVELDEGYAKVEMNASPECINFFGTVHGGAIFALLDQAFGAAANSHGTVAVALNVNISYLNPALPGRTIIAEAREVSRSNRISTYDIKARDDTGELIATFQAMAYRKKDRLPFLGPP